MTGNAYLKLMAVLVAGAALLAGEVRAADAPGEEILNSASYLRVSLGFRTPVVAGEDGQVKLLTAGKDNAPLPLFESTPPSADWKKPEFNDLYWVRTGLPVGGALAKDWPTVLQNNRCCVRGKFLVDDPANVKGLKLTLEYRGGVVVYLNGSEVKRAHLPAGELGVDAVAEQYPEDAYAANGALLVQSDKRSRSLEVELPQAGLKKGVNVVAVEVIRAPLRGSALAASRPKDMYHSPFDGCFWSHLKLDTFRLTAAPGSGIVANTSRPKGPQVWPVQPLETVTAMQYGDPAEKAAIDLNGVRNATVSGRFVVSSDTTLKGVKVTAGTLTGGNGASLPASAVQVRYAMPADENTGWIANVSKTGKLRYDILEDAAPAEVQIPATDGSAAGKGGAKSPAPGALLPVWVTINVPADAKPGVYKGEVVASAEGLTPVSIPVSITIHGWTLPDPDGYIALNDFTASHESVALVYKEPLWTDRHFELMGRSLELGERLGSRFCYANILLDGHCMGNSEGMIRWIQKADGTFDYDFEPFDKYLDLFAKKVGKPRALVLTVWVTSQHGFKGRVSRLDPATKKVVPMDIPPYKTPEAIGFWKPVMDQIRKRVEARGWWDVTVIGHTGDFTPTPKEVDCFKAIWPDGKWIFSAHMATTSLEASDKTRMPIVVGERVWGCGRLYNPDIKDAIYGTTYPQRWKTTPGTIEMVFPRTGQACMAGLGDDGRLALWKMSSEAAIQGNIHGFGRVGLDFWPLPGRRRTHWDSLAGSSNQGMGHSTLAIVGVGRNGPAPTERYEMCREGVQVREAIIYVQKALVAKKADAALLTRGKAMLDERARHYMRTMTEQNTPQAWFAFEGGGWQERDARLFALCAELNAGDAK